MEAELLRGMIVDRDNRIANIQRKQQDFLAKEERLKDELSEAAERNSSQIITQQTEKTALYHEQQGVLHQLENLHTHIQRQGDSLNEYVMYIQQNGEIAADDSQNVMRLQAQLCKAMHSMSIVDRQHEMLKEHNEKLLKFSKEELAKQSEDKAHLERSILNDLMECDTEVRGVENELKKELDGILKEMNAIREQLDDDESDEENEGEPEEDEEEEPEEEEELDEEEKAAKEEMMKLLQQRREEIERLEKEIEEKEELIEELQIRAGEEPPPEETPKVSVAAKKKVVEEEKQEEPEKEEPPRKEEKKEEPVDEMAARLQQVMASASNSKVDEVDEMDLLKLAQSRITGGGDVGGDDDEDDDDEDSEEEETETEIDEDYSEGVDNSGAAGEQSESAKAEEDEYDPTEKKEDPMVES